MIPFPSYRYEIGETVYFTGHRGVCMAHVTARRQVRSAVTGAPLSNIYDITTDGGSLLTCFERALRPAYRQAVARGAMFRPDGPEAA